jgi:predicted nucleotidyltransferase
LTQKTNPADVSQLEALVAQFEEQNNVDVLFAVVHGSRAWGLSGPGSDYDIKLIYRDPPEKAFALFPVDDHLTVNAAINGGEMDVEIAGWSLPKALKLAAASNAQIGEFINCDLKIRQDPDFFSDLVDLSAAASPRVMAHYYRGTAKKNILGRITKDPKTDIKTVLQAVRGLMSSRWFIQNPECGGFPPIKLDTLRSQVDLQGAKHALSGLDAEIDALIELKTTSSERKTDLSIPCLHYWMLGEIEALDKDIMVLPELFFDTPLVERVYRSQYPEVFAQSVEVEDLQMEG